jgi:hypothetical protein
LAGGEQRRRQAKGVGGGGSDAGTLHLQPCVERGRLAKAHPLEELSADQIVDGDLVPLAAQKLAGVNDKNFGIDLYPAVDFADLRRRVYRSPHLAQRPAHRPERVVRFRPEEIREFPARRGARFEQQIGKESPGLVAFEPA